MRLLRELVFAVFVAGPAALLTGCAEPDIARDLSQGAPKVLIVSNDVRPDYGRFEKEVPDMNYAPGIKRLLQKCKIPVTLALRGDTMRDGPEKFDLVIITGYPFQPSAPLADDRPVLMIGGFGYWTFGMLHLKNGSPFG